MSGLPWSDTWPNRNRANLGQAFVATLVVMGCKSISVRRDEHYVRFGQAVACMQELVARKAPGSQKFPRAIYPSNTGVYTDIDRALQPIPGGMVSFETPFDGAIRLTVTPTVAQSLLDEVWRIPAAQQSILRQMAEAFLAPIPPEAGR